MPLHPWKLWVQVTCDCSCWLRQQVHGEGDPVSEEKKGRVSPRTYGSTFVDGLTVSFFLTSTTLFLVSRSGHSCEFLLYRRLMVLPPNSREEHSLSNFLVKIILGMLSVPRSLLSWTCRRKLTEAPGLGLTVFLWKCVLLLYRLC